MPSPNLMIVESPAKAKTIEKYLGAGWRVVSSFGHVRDLPKSSIGVEPERGFAQEYVSTPDQKKKLSAIKKELGKDTTLWLATDPDREGEAIAWHVLEGLGIDPTKRKVHRVTFTEITKAAVSEAVKHPREIDTPLVEAQQARRVVDRLIGYELSPLLWKKVLRGLSAGRVQSVAVRLVVEREREIRAFVPEESWSVVATFVTEKGETFEAELVRVAEKKAALKVKAEADAILAELKSAKFAVSKVESRAVRRSPPPPFTTSTLQQAASSALGLSPKRTMALAQRLYEAGLITYMRTDSVNLSADAIAGARAAIASEFGKEFVPEKPRFYATKSKGAQEAHEAIRPTDFTRRGAGSEPGEEKLYRLIRGRAIACQMADAELRAVAIEVENR